MDLTFSKSSELIGLSEKETATIFENLSILSAEEALCRERREAQISELIRLLAGENRPLDRDALAESFETYLRDATTADLSIRRMDLVSLCKALIHLNVKISSDDPDEELPAPEPISPAASEKAAYLRNRFSDRAFLQLTAHCTRPRAAYFSSFTDVCEEVYHDLCEYCILPVENTRDGKLLRFYDLIEKFDLKIVSVTDIEEHDGVRTRYALLKHGEVQMILPKTNEDEQIFLEARLVLPENNLLSDLLVAASAFGLTPTRVDSIPLPYQDDRYRYDVVFLLSTQEGKAPPHGKSPSSRKIPESLRAFFLYLSLLLPEYSLLGIYTKV